MRDIILIGKQGSGKGTQGKLLAQDFGFKIFETGGALRAISQTDTDLGRTVLEITQRGDLVSNDIVMQIVEDFLENVEEGVPVIFDGIPRSEEQRVSLEAVLKKMGRDFKVVELLLDNDVAVQRMLARGRVDDTPEAIAKRLENFDAYTQPLIAVWKEQGLVHSVDGSGTIEEENEKIYRALGLEKPTSGGCGCCCG